MREPAGDRRHSGVVRREVRGPHTRSARPARGKLLIKPSKTAVKRIWERLRAEMRALRGTNARAVIARLNPTIRRWSAYCRLGPGRAAFGNTERLALARFLAACSGLTRHAYELDLGQYADSERAGQGCNLQLHEGMQHPDGLKLAGPFFGETAQAHSAGQAVQPQPGLYKLGVGVRVAPLAGSRTKAGS
jgi:hypothetical protein